MLQRIKSIHPGWFIGGFFALLIAFNVVFFVIAAVTPVDLIPRRAPAKEEVVTPPPDAAQDAGAAAVTTPTEPTGRR